VNAHAAFLSRTFVKISAAISRQCLTRNHLTSVSVIAYCAVGRKEFGIPALLLLHARQYLALASK
jgi:hypothetical protein